MDDPRCPISVAEKEARVEYELIRWQIIDGRQRRRAPARISQCLEHELWGLRPDAAPLQMAVPAIDCPRPVTLRQMDQAAKKIREICGAQFLALGHLRESYLELTLHPVVQTEHAMQCAVRRIQGQGTLEMWSSLH